MIRRRTPEQSFSEAAVGGFDAEKGGFERVYSASGLGDLKGTASMMTMLGKQVISLVVIVVIRAALAAFAVIATIVVLDVLYLTREAINFGDPCKLAADIRSQFATSTTQSPLPKIIHQQWKTDKLPPGLFTKVNMEWKRLYPVPEYSHILWTDETMRQLIKEKFPWFLETYDQYPTNIQRADASRYFILYTYGGLYADLDYEPYVNFWGDLPNDRVSLIESPYKQNENVQNSLMSSPVADPFWNVTFGVLYDRRNEKDILFSTGPVAMDESIRRSPDPSSVHILQCKNFHRIPSETAEEGKSFELRMNQKLRRYSPFVRTCGDSNRRDNCQFGGHHNAVSYNAVLKSMDKK
jgi:inositol phosphorylceramide mannosyltransferase catalytic subunit